jgi:phenylalanyl-tRNA synthetase beta chain
VFRHAASALGLDHFDLTPTTPPGYHPGRVASVVLNGLTIGHVGELSPALAREYEIPGRVAVAELDLEPLLAPVGLRQAVSPSVYPHVDFDLSFLIPMDLSVESVIRASVEAGAGLVETSRVFDQFQGPGVEEGKRAVAISYRLRSDDHTLSNEEVKPVREAMITAAESVGARLRGA